MIERIIVEETEDYRLEVTVAAGENGGVRLGVELWEDPDDPDPVVGPSGSWADLTPEQAESLSKALGAPLVPHVDPPDTDGRGPFGI